MLQTWTGQRDWSRRKRSFAFIEAVRDIVRAERVERVLHQEGAHAEVVSGFELGLARSLGVMGREIVYNGPHKPLDALQEAIALGARINADSLEELSDLQELARQANRRVKVGIRVNMALNDPPWDRFGFNLESGQALDACRRVHASPSLSLAGFHIHAGTFLTQVDLYGRAVTALLTLAKTIDARGWGVIEYLDLGGGYTSHNTLQGLFLSGGGHGLEWRHSDSARLCRPRSAVRAHDSEDLSRGAAAPSAASCVGPARRARLALFPAPRHSPQFCGSAAPTGVQMPHVRAG